MVVGDAECGIKPRHIICGKLLVTVGREELSRERSRAAVAMHTPKSPPSRSACLARGRQRPPLCRLDPLPFLVRGGNENTTPLPLDVVFPESIHGSLIPEHHADARHGTPRIHPWSDAGDNSSSTQSSASSGRSSSGSASWVSAANVGGTCSLAALGFGLFLAPCSFPFCRVITQIRGIDGKSL
jgi:hypothetical protein